MSILYYEIKCDSDKNRRFQIEPTIKLSTKKVNLGYSQPNITDHQITHCWDNGWIIHISINIDNPNYDSIVTKLVTWSGFDPRISESVKSLVMIMVREHKINSLIE